MSTLQEAIVLYKEALIKNKTKLQNELEILKKRLKTSRTTKNLIIKIINENIRNLEQKIEEHIDRIESHTELIIETEDGTLEDTESD